MTCKCGSERIISFMGKCADLFNMSFKGENVVENDYVPNDMGIGGGDYLNLTFCADCGQIQGNFPIDHELLE